MGTISIGNAERPLRDADASWIKRQFDEQRRLGRLPCVRVAVSAGNIHVGLQTPNCSAGGGGGRSPNPDERKMIELWNMEGLSTPTFTEKQVIDFVERVRHIIR